MSKKDKKDMIQKESCLSLHYLIRVLKTPIQRDPRQQLQLLHRHLKRRHCRSTHQSN